MKYDKIHFIFELKTTLRVNIFYWILYWGKLSSLPKNKLKKSDDSILTIIIDIYVFIYQSSLLITLNSLCLDAICSDPIVFTKQLLEHAIYDQADYQTSELICFHTYFCAL